MASKGEKLQEVPRYLVWLTNNSMVNWKLFEELVTNSLPLQETKTNPPPFRGLQQFLSLSSTPKLPRKNGVKYFANSFLE